MNKNKRIWQDRHIKKYIYILLSFSMFITFLVIGFKKLINPELSLEYFSIILILAFSLLLLINILRVRLSFIAFDGIRIGSAVDNSYERFRLKQKPTLIKWDNIKNIKIYGKDVSTALAPGTIDMLLVKTKDNIKFESFIAQPKDFVQTIKNLKKDYLFAKDSKYLK